MDGEEKTYGGCEGPDAMYVKLISSDGHEFIVKREHALTSGTIKAMLSGPGQFAENETNEVNFREIPSHVLSKVCMYFTYKVRYTNSSTEIPEFPIAPEIAWFIDMEGAPGTLYEGEKFQLLFKFSSRYPFDSPQVMFTGENIPVHPHVYSNGHICLSILTEDWSPALSVQSRRPPDNSFYVKTCNKNPKKTKWWYHDDTC
ncbi:ubiquitin-conjugating enzyme E2 W [Labeo rohita]|uniref:Elongin-C n=1 Tax=Labeo rohita TaxID=84645 RepID=A0A498LJF1_LABRO|nr:ubiquitin-conjugating enzyme E2 W [Labeo rohita]